MLRGMSLKGDHWEASAPLVVALVIAGLIFAGIAFLNRGEPAPRIVPLPENQGLAS